MEEVAGSDSFSDFVDRAEYLQTMQLKIKETVDRIKALKKELEAQKQSLIKKTQDLEEMKKQQLLQKQSLDGQKAYKDTLLAQAQASADALQTKLNDLHAEKAAMSRQYNEILNIGGSGGYPYGSPSSNPDTPDPWGYLKGECTSYSAWWRQSRGRPVPRNLGNANTWASNAAAQGLPVDSNPSVGSVIVMPYVGYYGHVGIVEAVYGNGSVLISEYNWVPFSYTTRVINPYNYGARFIH